MSGPTTTNAVAVFASSSGVRPVSVRIPTLEDLEGYPKDRAKRPGYRLGCALAARRASPLVDIMVSSAASFRDVASESGAQESTISIENKVNDLTGSGVLETSKFFNVLDTDRPDR